MSDALAKENSLLCKNITNQIEKIAKSAKVKKTVYLQYTVSSRIFKLIFRHLMYFPSQLVYSTVLIFFHVLYSNIYQFADGGKC
jgi:hypothetical protein